MSAVGAEEKSVCVCDGLWQPAGRLAFTSAEEQTGFVLGLCPRQIIYTVADNFPQNAGQSIWL